MGNSNITAYDQESDTVDFNDGSTGNLSQYLTDQFVGELSYEDYLASAENNLPALGNFGFNSETNTLWAVIDHNSSFAVASTETSKPILLGDCNLDGFVNFSDISTFISTLSMENYLEQADTNQDGIVDFADISSFISLLSSN